MVLWKWGLTLIKRRITCGVFIHNPDGQLLVCHATETSWNVWGIPKGRPDEGETHMTAAIREVYEETGFDLTPFKDLMEYIGGEDYKTSDKRLEAWVVRLPVDVGIKFFHCNSLFQSLYSGDMVEEVDAFQWVEFQDFKDKMHRTARTLWERYIE